MNYSNDTLARFLLCNDIKGAPVLTNEEFYEFEKKFYDKDLSSLKNIPLWQLVDITGDSQKAEKIYLALKKNYDEFFEKLNNAGIKILTNKDTDYPVRLTEKLGTNAPVFLYSFGDTRLMNMRSSAVTGSRKISEKGLKFSYDIGETIALENRVLISGGANGCDKNATASAIKSGGKAVWFLAVSFCEILKKREVAEWIKDKKICLCSDFNPFGEFQGKIALRRNRYIYANAETAFVCQCNSKISGTYSGANFALKNNLCEMFVYDNNTEADKLLIKNGAIAIVDN